MINQARMLNTLRREGIEFFVGVPDSYLNGFCNYLLEKVPEKESYGCGKMKEMRLELQLDIISAPIRFLLCICRIQAWEMHLTPLLHW